MISSLRSRFLLGVVLFLFAPPLSGQAQFSPLTLLDPSLRSNGSSLEALFDKGAGVLQKEIDNQLYRAQPAVVRISWPLLRVAGVPGALAQSERRISVVRGTVRISNSNFATDSDREQVLEWIHASSGAVQIGDVKEALQSQDIGITTATRIVFNRYAAFQLLESRGAEMTYVTTYGSREQPAKSVSASRLNWIFRKVAPSSLPRTTNFHLVTVDVVSDSVTVPLINSNDGGAFLSQVRATASIATTKSFSSVRLGGREATVQNPDSVARGGDDFPLVIDLASQQIGQQLRRAEREGRVTQEVGLGMMASVDDSPDKASYAGLTVGFPRAFGIEGILHPGLSAGLNDQSDVFLGGGLTFGSTLNVSAGWRVTDDDDGGDNSLGITASVNLRGLLDRATEDQPPIDVRANKELLSRTSADQNILDATLSAFSVDVADSTGMVPDSLQSAVNVELVADPAPNTQGTLQVEVDKGSGRGIDLPALPGTYRNPRLLLRRRGLGPVTVPVEIDEAIRLRKGIVGQLQVTWNDGEDTASATYAER